MNNEINKLQYNSITDFFEILNSNSSYVILRNFEDLENNIQNSEHPDIDLLCNDRNYMLSLINSTSRNLVNDDKVHRYIKVANKDIALDIREIGDGYLDKKWENNILENRLLYRKLYYIPDDSNYFFSLLYHILIQKHTIAEDYLKKLSYLASKIGLVYSNIPDLNILEDYMRKQGYIYAYPEKPYTVFNVEKCSSDLVEKNHLRYFSRVIYCFLEKLKRLKKWVKK